jgi:GT2 family glycosyltransferase
MHAANHGAVWMGDVSPDRMKYDDARNRVVEEACRSDADWVFWCDSDIVLPVDAISTLLARARQFDHHFLTGIYFQRAAPYFPLVAHRDPKGSFQWVVKWPPNAYFPVDGCGFGVVLTSISMLRAIEPPWFKYEKYSEDFDFCIKAAAKGYKLYCDSSVRCGHLANPRPITFDDFALEAEGFGVTLSKGA